MVEVLFNDEFSYSPPAGNCKCNLALVKSGETYFAIATERDDNPGLSITNSAEELAIAVVKQFHIEDPANNLVMIEHYGNGSFSFDIADEYSRVNLFWVQIIDEYYAYEAEWNAINGALVDRLTDVIQNLQ